MSDVAKVLADLDSTIATLGPVSTDELFSVHISRATLQMQRAQVIAEMAGELDLKLTRASAHGTGAELSLVSNVLKGLQDSLASIAQVIAGRPTARGAIPSEIANAVQLRVLEASPGSLNLRLVPAGPLEGDQLQFERGEEGSLLNSSVERFLGLLEHASSTSDEALLSDVAEFGGRTVAHIQKLSNALAESEASAMLEWRSRSGVRNATLSTVAARHLSTFLDEVVEDTRELTLVGRLVGGSLIRRTFEFEPNEGDGTVVSGAASDQAIGNFGLLFGEECTARLSVNEAKLPSGETRDKYWLIALTP